jgi:hypothetical protein
VNCEGSSKPPDEWGACVECGRWLKTLNPDGAVPLHVVPSCSSKRAAPDEWNACLECGRQFVPYDADKIAKDRDRLEKSLRPDGTVPGHNEVKLPSVRQIYCAAPELELTHADGSQIELRVMAAVAPDSELQRRLDAGDVYSWDAIDWYNIRPPDCICPANETHSMCPASWHDVAEPKKHIKPAARKQAKIGHLAFQYAAAVVTGWLQALRQDRSITLELMRGISRGFLATYKETKLYWYEEHARVLACGYSESRIMQRRRYYPRPPDLSAAVNWPIQSTAADHMNLAIIGVWADLKKLKRPARLLVQLHDALDVEHHPSDRSDVENILKEHMSAPRKLTNGRTLNIPLEIKQGQYWSEV